MNVINHSRHRSDRPDDAAFRTARTCYDHLAGRLGVALADALQNRGYVRFENGTGLITESGQRFLGAFGLDLAPQADLKSNGRAPCRACLDGTERRPHLAGAVSGLLRVPASLILAGSSASAAAAPS